MTGQATDDYFAWADAAFALEAIGAKPEALAHVRVIEVCTRIFGPAAPDYLADFGAEVIKIELPGAGDFMRYVTREGFFHKNCSPAFTPQNRNKRFVAVDIRKPAGRDLFLRLAAQADVVIENFKPGTMDRWGIGYRQLSAVNPGLIYSAHSGFGQWGPYSVGRPSYDGTAQAMSGLAAITGFPDAEPLRIGIFIGDWHGALLSTIAVLAALHWRRRSGRGQFIDIAQGDGLLRAMDWTWLYHQLAGRERPRAGNRDLAMAPAGIYPCRDGFVAIAAPGDATFAGLCHALGQPELAADRRFRTGLDRLCPEHAIQLDALLGAWAAVQSRDEVEAAGQAEGFAVGRVVNAADQHADPHLRARAAVWEWEDALYGRVAEYGPAPKLSRTPGRLKWTARPVGFHNAQVLGPLLGLTDEDFRRLEGEGIIGRWADRVGARPPEDWDGTVPEPPVRGRRPPLQGLSPLPKEPWGELAERHTHPRNTGGKPEALEGLLILDVGRGHFGTAVCAAALGEFGAEVIKLEPPGGDPLRRMSPDGFLHQATGLAYLAEARNAHHATCNLEVPVGRDLFRRLALRADVVIESFPAGQMDAWGIGYRQLAAENPRLLYVALTAEGQFGPRAPLRRPDVDVVDQALSGAVYLTGEPRPEGGAPIQRRLGGRTPSQRRSVPGTAGSPRGCGQPLPCWPRWRRARCLALAR